MKKTKFLLLLLVMLAAILLCCSCGYDWEDTFLTVPPETAVPYQTAERLSALLDAEVVDQKGELVYLISSVDEELEKHIVYDLFAGTVVYSRPETGITQIELSLESVYEAVLIVERVETARAGDTVAVTTSLYSKDGATVASTTNADPTLELACDLIYFEGKYYRAYDNGGVSFAFDYPATAKRPALFAMSAKYYYATYDDVCTVYTREDMSLVSYVGFPSYAKNANSMVLSNGNILMQYMIVHPADAEEYTLFFGGEKVTLVTQIFDVEEAKTERIDTTYMINDSVSAVIAAKEWKKKGLDAKELPNLVTVWMIDGVYLNTESTASQTVTIGDDGEIEDVLTVEGQQITEIQMLGENRWCLHTVLGKKYLVDKKGTVLADLSDAQLHGKWILAAGKIYDLGMQELYDYGKDSATVLKMIDNAILLQNGNGDVVCFTGESTSLKVTGASDSATYYEARGGAYILRDSLSAQYTVYSHIGTKLITLEDVQAFEIVAQGKGATMICVTNEEGKVYFRLV